MILEAGAIGAASAPSMMSILGPAAVLGGLGFGSSLLSNSAQSSANSKALKWQRYNMQHAHQWEVEDLKKAGLNPILSATGGSGAVGGSVPNAPLPGIKMGDVQTGLQVSTAQQSIRESQARERLFKEQATTQKGDPKNIVGGVMEDTIQNAKELPGAVKDTGSAIGKAAAGILSPAVKTMQDIFGPNSAKHKPVPPSHPDKYIDDQLKTRFKLRKYDDAGRNYDTREYWR